MRTLYRVAFLTSIWVLAWGRLSLANVASGIALSLVLLVVYPIRLAAGGERPLVRPRLFASIRLIAAIVVDLLTSNAHLAREIVTRKSRIRTGIVACPLTTESEAVVTVLTVVLSLSPGQMPVGVQTDPSVIFVHVLHLRDADVTRRRVLRMEALIRHAIEQPGAETTSPTPASATTPATTPGEGPS